MLRLKSPNRDTTTHIVVSPLEFTYSLFSLHTKLLKQPLAYGARLTGIGRVRPGLQAAANDFAVLLRIRILIP